MLKQSSDCAFLCVFFVSACSDKSTNITRLPKTDMCLEFIDRLDVEQGGKTMPCDQSYNRNQVNVTETSGCRTVTSPKGAPEIRNIPQSDIRPAKHTEPEPSTSRPGDDGGDTDQARQTGSGRYANLGVTDLSWR